MSSDLFWKKLRPILLITVQVTSTSDLYCRMTIPIILRPSELKDSYRFRDSIPQSFFSNIIVEQILNDGKYTKKILKCTLKEFESLIYTELDNMFKNSYSKTLGKYLFIQIIINQINFKELFEEIIEFAKHQEDGIEELQKWGKIFRKNNPNFGKDVPIRQ